MEDAKIAVVTGSSSGIGLLTAIEFARSGYRVVATMRDLGRRDGWTMRRRRPASAIASTCGSSTSPTTTRCQQLSMDIIRDHGRIDVLVNNAGFSTSAFAEDMQLHELRDQMETNFFGAVAMTKAVLPVMRKQRSGHIVQVSSVSGRDAGAHAEQLFCVEVCAGGMERSSAHRSSLAGHSRGDRATRLVRHRHLGAQSDDRQSRRWMRFAESRSAANASQNSSSDGIKAG